MKSACLAIAAALVAVAFAPAGNASEDHQPKSGAVIGNLDLRKNGRGNLYVIGGSVSSGGWLDSDKVDGLMGKGAELTICSLTEGAVGTAKLLSDGKLGSEDPLDNVFTEGRWYRCQVSMPGEWLAEYWKQHDRWQDGEKQVEPPALMALWHSTNRPAPKWIKGERLDPGNVVYREVIADWVKQKGVSPETISSIIVEQIVRADIDGDRRDEVFVSFRTPNTPAPEWIPQPTKDTFSYLLMRYPPRGSKEPRTIIVSHVPNLVHKVTGLCDLDGDGSAEATTIDYGYDVWGGTLYHRTDGEFKAVASWGGGC